MKQSKTNETTTKIIEYFFTIGVFAWRQNSSGIPLVGGGFRPAAKRGVPDILAVLPPNGRFVGVEVKTGKDKVSAEQEGFHTTARKLGGIVLVVRDYEDFLTQWKEVSET